MSYTARDLQREGKKILDLATIAPVLVRRGDEFFTIRKVEVEPKEEALFGQISEPKIAKVHTEPTYVPDPEYESGLQQAINSGQIKKGF